MAALNRSRKEGYETMCPLCAESVRDLQFQARQAAFERSTAAKMAWPRDTYCPPDFQYVADAVLEDLEEAFGPFEEAFDPDSVDPAFFEDVCICSLIVYRCKPGA